MKVKGIYNINSCIGIILQSYINPCSILTDPVQSAQMCTNCCVIKYLKYEKCIICSHGVKGNMDVNVNDVQRGQIKTNKQTDLYGQERT